MLIYFRGEMYKFRECDTEGMTEAHVIARSDEHGELRKKANGEICLYVRGIGYARLVEQ